MSAVAQQQQQSQQVQQPTQQQGAQQGPVPEAGSFGSENAVEFQGAYGNGAVAGMAGVEGAGMEAEAQEEEGGSFEKEEPHLASTIGEVLQRSDAALSDRGSWATRVPPSLQADANRVVTGLAHVDGYLMGLQTELRGLFSAEERDEYAIANGIISAEEVLERVEVAVDIVNAYKALYLGAVADVAGVAIAFAEFAHIGAELLEQRGKAQAAQRRSEEAFGSMTAAAQDIVEVNLQTAAKAGLTIAEDALKVAIVGATGPLALPLVILTGLVFGKMGDDLDAKLGTEPAELSFGLDEVTGELSSQWGRLATIGEQMGASKEVSEIIGEALGGIDKALFLFDAVEEGSAATMAFIQSAADYREAQKQLHTICSEVEQFYNEDLPELLDALKEIPELVAEAKADAARAAATIADLEGHYGDGLYAPPAS